jgi:enoyl-CoA hydratase/carnithine racemase
MVAAGGVPFAKEIFLAANTLTAERALTLGYLFDAVADTGLEHATMYLALQIVANVKGVVAACKQSINFAAGLPAAGATVSDSTVVRSYLSEEFRKRVKPS